MIEIQLNNAQTILAPEKDSNSRYYHTSFVKNDENIILLNLFRTVDYTNDTENLQYHIVKPTEANRIDKIAHDYYGDSSFWWLIAIANNMINPFVLVPGTTIKVPLTQTYIAKGIAERFNNG